MLRLYKARLQKYPITYLLIGINILVYIYICSHGHKPFLSSFFDGPGYDTLLLYGAKENSLIALGQVYRLFLPMFIHSNFVHLIVNMLGLWSVGRIFENIVGAKPLLILYLVSGITGNLCSFAILPHLSVGASGSLFGVLFCLYVIQKYQEKINQNLKNKSTQFQFGNIILINAFLNIVFGITFPIFDWACHLGGSIAGTLFGFVIVTKHSWKVRLFMHVVTNSNAFSHGNILKKKFFERHIIYYFGILLINISFFLAVFKIEKYQKIAGLASYFAAKNSTSPLNYEDIAQYKELLISINKETNPDNLLYGAFYLAQKKEYFASYKLFFLLSELAKYSFKSPSLNETDYKYLIENGLAFSKQDLNPATKIPHLNINHSVDYKNQEDYCAMPANLFMALGFFEIAGNLYECAYALNRKNDSYALKSFESFYIAKDQRGMAQVLSLVKTLSP